MACDSSRRVIQSTEFSLMKHPKHRTYSALSLGIVGSRSVVLLAFVVVFHGVDERSAFLVIGAGSVAATLRTWLTVPWLKLEKVLVRLPIRAIFGGCLT